MIHSFPFSIGPCCLCMHATHVAKDSMHLYRVSKRRETFFWRLELLCLPHSPFPFPICHFPFAMCHRLSSIGNCAKWMSMQILLQQQRQQTTTTTTNNKNTSLSALITFYWRKKTINKIENRKYKIQSELQSLLLMLLSRPVFRMCVCVWVCLWFS